MLNSGEVPDLFDNEELDGIAMDLKSAAAQASIPDTRQDVYQFFIEVCTLYDTYQRSFQSMAALYKCWIIFGSEELDICKLFYFVFLVLEMMLFAKQYVKYGIQCGEYILQFINKSTLKCIYNFVSFCNK